MRERASTQSEIFTLGKFHASAQVATKLSAWGILFIFPALDSAEKVLDNIGTDII